MTKLFETQLLQLDQKSRTPPPEKKKKKKSLFFVPQLYLVLKLVLRLTDCGAAGFGISHNKGLRLGRVGGVGGEEEEEEGGL